MRTAKVLVLSLAVSSLVGFTSYAGIMDDALRNYLDIHEIERDVDVLYFDEEAVVVSFEGCVRALKLSTDINERSDVFTLYMTDEQYKEVVNYVDSEF